MFSNLNDIFDKSLNIYKRNNIEYHEKKQRNIVNAKLVSEKMTNKQIEIDKNKKERQKSFDIIRNR